MDGKSVRVPDSPRFSGHNRASCQVVDREAVRYFFNGLPKDQTEVIRVHLRECPRCRGRLKVFESAWVDVGKRRRGR